MNFHVPYAHLGGCVRISCTYESATISHRFVTPRRRAPNLALQLRLGLLSQRRLGLGAGDLVGPCTDAPYVIESRKNLQQAGMKPPEDSTPHEFIDAEIVVDGIETPADETALSTALSGLAGIRNLTIAGGKVSVEYDPIEVTKARLTEVITRSGYRIVDVESAPASALSDALHPENPEPDASHQE